MNCDSCGLPAVLRCGKCQVVYYCNSACQKKAWSEHKKVCDKNFMIKIDSTGKQVPSTEEEVQKFYRDGGDPSAMRVNVSREDIEALSKVFEAMRTQQTELQFQTLHDSMPRLVIDVRKRDVATEAEAIELSKALHAIVREHTTAKTAVLVMEGTSTFRFVFPDFLVVNRSIFEVITKLLNKSMGASKFRAVEVVSNECRCTACGSLR